MTHSTDRLTALRREMAILEHGRAAGAARPVPLGLTAIDAALGGGLARGRLHEIFAAEGADAGSAAGFAAMLAVQISSSRTGMRSGSDGDLRAGSGHGSRAGPFIWLREPYGRQEAGALYAPGLAGLGLDPARLVLADLPDAAAVLKAAAEAVRCPQACIVVAELWRKPRLLDLTASRRLSLAAEAAGTTVLMLRIEAEEEPSAAQTRWRVAAAPSRALAAGAPGHPALILELLRQRGRPAGGCWLVEWDHDRASFRAHADDGAAGADLREAFPGARLPLPAHGQAAPLRRVG